MSFSTALPAIPGLSFRPLSVADVNDWLSLVQRIAGADEAAWHDQRSDLMEVLESEVNPAELNTIGALDADGILRAYGYVSKNPESGVGFSFAGVDPQWRRRGVGSAVLAWQEEQLRARFAADGQDHPRIRSYAEEVTPGHKEMLAATGFKQVRVFTTVARDLADLPNAVQARGVSILPYSPELSEGMRLAHNEAFADHWGSEQRSVQKWAKLMGHESFRADWTSVAVDDESGEVVGYQVSMFDPTVLQATGIKEGYTEILGVRRAWRGRGVAPALLIDAMGKYRAGGMDRAVLDVDTENPSGAHHLYARLGYRPVPRQSSTAWDKEL